MPSTVPDTELMQKKVVTIIFIFIFFFFFDPHGIWNFWARNQIQGAAATYSSAAAKPDPFFFFFLKVKIFILIDFSMYSSI